MANFDDMKLAVESLSGGKNTVLYDDLEMPSVMVVWPKQTNKALFDGSEIVHPGSIVNGVEKTMYVSKFQNIVFNNRAYSLPYRDPRTSVNFDTALGYCRNKGTGWGLVPFSLWAQISLWCRKNGTMPRGNNSYGHDHAYTHERGVPTSYESVSSASHAGEPNRCATGSGPATWNHNWLPDGIADLNGNVNEWCAGMRIVDGEIQIIPYANSMLSEVSLGAASTSWKAINANGDLVEPGTAGTLHYDWIDNKITVTTAAPTFTEDTYKGAQYKDLAAASGLTLPEIAKALTLYPDEPNGDYGGDCRYVNMTGERLPICGGYWLSAGSAGVFYVDLGNLRTGAYGAFGFRSAFCEL